MNVNDDNIRTQMRKGILELCVLLTLSHGRAYPSDILRSLRQAGLSVVEGTLYTLLNRLRRDGHLDYEWEESTMGPPRKYYTLSESGQRLLEALMAEWKLISDAISNFI